MQRRGFSTAVGALGTLPSVLDTPAGLCGGHPHQGRSTLYFSGDADDADKLLDNTFVANKEMALTTKATAS